MNLPTSGSRGAAAWEGNFSRIYIRKQNTGQALAPRAAQTGMRPRGLQLQAGQACPAATLLEAEPKAPAHFSQVAQARHCWSLAGRSPNPPQSTLGPTVPSLMDVVPYWHPPTQTYQEAFPATDNSLNGSWLNSSCSVGFEKCSIAAGGALGCYI